MRITNGKLQVLSDKRNQRTGDINNSTNKELLIHEDSYGPSLINFTKKSQLLRESIVHLSLDKQSHFKVNLEHTSLIKSYWDD